MKKRFKLKKFNKKAKENNIGKISILKIGEKQTIQNTRNPWKEKTKGKKKPI